jgi:hypothetical protein
VSIESFGPRVESNTDMRARMMMDATTVGEVMCLDVLGRPMIVFNSLKSAFEVLERRARNSSGRPRFIVAGEIVNQGLALGLMDHGDL